MLILVCFWVQFTLKPGTSVKKAAAAVHKAASGNELRGHLSWRAGACVQYEHEVASLQRFLVDASVSGGALQPSVNVC